MMMLSKHVLFIKTFRRREINFLLSINFAIFFFKIMFINLSNSNNVFFFRNCNNMMNIKIIKKRLKVNHFRPYQINHSKIVLQINQTRSLINNNDRLFVHFKIIIIKHSLDVNKVIINNHCNYNNNTFITMKRTKTKISIKKITMITRNIQKMKNMQKIFLTILIMNIMIMIQKFTTSKTSSYKHLDRLKEILNANDAVKNFSHAINFINIFEIANRRKKKN